MNRLTCFVFLSCLVWFASCGRQSSPAPEGVQTFRVKGVIKKLEPEENRVVIQHEEIPDYMDAMTMPFDVQDARELEGLQPGDEITFRLNVTEDDSWIDQIEKTGNTSTEEPPTRPPVRIVRNVEPLEVGDLMPDYQFTNELGRAIQLSDFRGKALAFTFIFTRCPIPDFCPLMSKNFAAAAKQLQQTPGGPENFHFLTISFDPHFDTPEVLRNYGQRYQYDPRKWSFVSGAMIDIDAITEQFDLPVIVQGDSWDHKLRTVVVDANGRIQKIFVGNSWKPEELAGEVAKAARVEPGS